MEKIGIVILNYINYKDTIECANSALRLSYLNKCIVIIDNASPNDSYVHLKKIYKKSNSIHVLSLKKNLGYAEGNNAGIVYCREKEKCNYVLIVNNDTVFVQKNFIEILLSNVSGIANDNIGAIGPKIVDNNGNNQNPVYVSTSFSRIFKDLIINLLFFLKLFYYLKRVFHLKDSQDSMKNTYGNNYILHGAAILLTPQYFSYLKGLYPNTFLYYEENILGIVLKKFNLSFSVNFDAIIFHKEDGSSKLSFKNETSIKGKYTIRSIFQALKLKFLNKNQIRRIINKC